MTELKLLEYWAVFSGAGVIILNASLMMAWIDIKRHGKLLRRISERLWGVEENVLALNRQLLEEDSPPGRRFQRRLADRENGP